MNVWKRINERGMQLGNNTEIKYLNIQSKLYQITDISFYHMTIEAVETDILVTDVPEQEVWKLEMFKDYKITLINNRGQAEIVDFEKWKSKNRT